MIKIYRYDLVLQDICTLQINTDKELELMTDINNLNATLWIGSMTRIDFPMYLQVKLESVDE